MKSSRNDEEVHAENAKRKENAENAKEINLLETKNLQLGDMVKMNTKIKGSCKVKRFTQRTRRR